MSDCSQLCTRASSLQMSYLHPDMLKRRDSLCVGLNIRWDCSVRAVADGVAFSLCRSPILVDKGLCDLKLNVRMESSYRLGGLLHLISQARMGLPDSLTSSARFRGEE